MQTWIEKSKEVAFKSFLFEMFKVKFCANKTGKEGFFDVLESKDWANIIPITNDNEVIMVKQFRFGTQEVTLEFPAGSVENGEEPLDAIKRELLEETGSEGAQIIEVGRCRPNPAFLNNTCYHFVAKGVEFKKAQNLDEFEEIEFILVPVEKINELITTGEINHSLSITAWHFYRQFNGY